MRNDRRVLKVKVAALGKSRLQGASFLPVAPPIRHRHRLRTAARCVARILPIMFVNVAAAQPPAVDEAALRKSITLYASFDDVAQADFGGGDLKLSTRFNDPSAPGQFVFTNGFDAKVFRIAPGRGVSGGALDCADVLPRNGRIFFPARGNIAFRKGGWAGAASFWMNTDPNTMLKTSFCDPVQLTQKGAGNGGIWVDFNNAKPRDLRHGAFPAVAEGQKSISESDPQAPIVWAKGINFKSGNWHHVVIAWKNFDTGRKDGHSALYIDGKLIGEIAGHDIRMDWDLDKAGIYVAVSYIGLLDELALFDRMLTPDEVMYLHRHPAALLPLKRGLGARIPSSVTPQSK